MNKEEDLKYSVWKRKYAAPGEDTYAEMHYRLARALAGIEAKYIKKEKSLLSWFKRRKLSDYGKTRKDLTSPKIFDLLANFKYIVPQGSIMASAGRTDIVTSLSNCFVVGQPEDSYGGIMKKDEQLAQLMKRRGGVGLDLSPLRPKGVKVTNSAGSSTGIRPFMERYSNTTREVAQDGRRGALLMSVDCRHPDVLDFINAKQDRTKVTGANISVMMRDELMRAASYNEDYLLRWPCDMDISEAKDFGMYPYNELMAYGEGYVKRVKAKDIYNAIIHNAWDNAEPGVLFVDAHWDRSPDTVYPEYKGVTTNPCFHPDTLIETEFGRMKIKDITKPMRVYSMDSDGKLVMSNASASFLSKKNAETLKITLKSGTSITVTPEHKLYVQGIGWIEAKDLKVGNQLGHLCRSRRGAKYAGVHLTTSPNKQKDQVMEHKLVYGQHEAGMNIHHKDRNTYNNSITNLELLSHSEHSRLTALEDNPQTHQVRNELGKFISGENSKRGKKDIVDMPCELKTNVLSHMHNTIISIEPGEITDVYDIQVEKTHCVIANNIVAHNCGEIFMQEYDACRLLAINLFSFVKNPFTSEAEFDYELFYQVAYEQQRLADDVVDLELEHIDRIIEKIQSDPEDIGSRATELDLWQNIRKVAASGRRTGCGFTALGDTLAALGLKYDNSIETQMFLDAVFSEKMIAEVDASVDLAVLRGTFKGWDSEKEFDILFNNGNAFHAFGKNAFYEMLTRELPPDTLMRLINYGRRNISWSTVAPTGTVSLMTETTSGIEPLFMPYYTRRRKINPNDPDARIDYTDQNGDTWQEYPVIHPKFQDWIEKIYLNETYGYHITYGGTQKFLNEYPLFSTPFMEKAFEASPWYGSLAEDVPIKDRIAVQAIVQKYTTHSISSTLNLPKTTTEAEVADVFRLAWQKKLKGVTIYRDGCRSGVLVKEGSSETQTFSYKDAHKRPKVLDCDFYNATSNGQNYEIFVGLIDEKPYEIFARRNDVKNSSCRGTLTKVKRGVYKFECDNFSIENITENVSEEEELVTRLISANLRSGHDVKFIVEQLNKTQGVMTSFSKVVARYLKKYIPDGSKSTVSCNECGSSDVIFEEGCQKCLSCGNSKCG